jgi:hypothetical protein
MSETAAECLRIRLSVLASAARRRSRNYVECGADIEMCSPRNNYGSIACQGSRNAGCHDTRGCP